MLPNSVLFTGFARMAFATCIQSVSMTIGVVVLFVLFSHRNTSNSPMASASACKSLCISLHKASLFITNTCSDTVYILLHITRRVDVTLKHASRRFDPLIILRCYTVSVACIFLLLCL
ncbi:hypothetical protein P8452_10337 [Trifolium repens]|nr:hypothetical protein P8452_10337 [Trifolium repens]